MADHAACLVSIRLLLQLAWKPQQTIAMVHAQAIELLACTCTGGDTVPICQKIADQCQAQPIRCARNPKTA